MYFNPPKTVRNSLSLSPRHSTKYKKLFSLRLLEREPNGCSGLSLRLFHYFHPKEETQSNAGVLQKQSHLSLNCFSLRVSLFVIGLLGGFCMSNLTIYFFHFLALQTVDIKVKMDCDGCERRVKNAVSNMKGSN